MDAWLAFAAVTWTLLVISPAEPSKVQQRIEGFADELACTGAIPYRQGNSATTWGNVAAAGDVHVEGASLDYVCEPPQAAPPPPNHICIADMNGDGTVVTDEWQRCSTACLDDACRACCLAQYQANP